MFTREVAGRWQVRFVRFDDDGSAVVGVLDGDTIFSLAELAAEFPTMLSIIHGGGQALGRIREYLKTKDKGRPAGTVRLLAPIEQPGKYLAIGMNYRKHVEESARVGVSAPPNQMWFNKQTTCIAGPFDAIEPGVTKKLDYEIELGAVIGKQAKGVSQAAAADHVFGYFVANDVSARDWQFHTPTFTMGKSFDTHGPIGPCIVTADELGDPHTLDMRCYVNGELRQQSNTSQMLSNLWQQIEYLTTAFTLQPGDLIATGTPEGVGAGMEPPTFLQPGDIVRCEIDGIGAIENRVAAGKRRDGALAR